MSASLWAALLFAAALAQLSGGAPSAGSSGTLGLPSLVIGDWSIMGGLGHPDISCLQCSDAPGGTVGTRWPGRRPKSPAPATAFNPGELWCTAQKGIWTPPSTCYVPKK